MKATEQELAPENIDFFAAARENSGRSIPDYLISEMDEKAKMTINTPRWLNQAFEIQRDLQKEIQQYANEITDGEMSWQDIAHAFMKEVKGLMLVQDFKDGDFDQDFVCEVWSDVDSPSNQPEEDEETYSVIYMNSGPGPRGKYGRPIVTKSMMYELYPASESCHVGYTAVDGWDKDGKRLEDPDDIDQKLEWGWNRSGKCYQILTEEVKEFLGKTEVEDEYTGETIDGMKVKLHSGETLIITRDFDID